MEAGLNVKMKYLIPPVKIYEGKKAEIIIDQGTFLEIFNDNGDLIKRLGRKGKGPGEFDTVILKLIQFEDYYYILDHPNLLNIFDLNFNFIKRFYLYGNLSSRLIYDFDVTKDYIITVQKWIAEEDRYKEKEGKMVTLYNHRGKYIDSFFKKEIGFDTYPENFLLQGRIAAQKYIFFAFFTMNKIWKMDYKGNIINSGTFGENCWKNVIFNEKEYNISRKRGEPFQKLYEEIINSGNIIDGIGIYNNFLLIRASREEDFHADTFIFLIDLDFKDKFGPLRLPGYDFSGIGSSYLYFSRHIDEYSFENKMQVEVLKCVLN